MALVDLVMPKMGESIMEATILKWLKQPGETIKMDETLLEIATDKVDSEVPSTTAGVLDSVLFNVNDVVPVGAVIARINTEATAEASNNNTPTSPTTRQPEAQLADVVSSSPTVHHNYSTESATRPSNGTTKFYSPLVLNIAQSEGVSMGELEQIDGTGNDGRVTKKDILEYVSNKKSGKRGDVQVSTSSVQQYKRPASTETLNVESNEQMVPAKTYSGNVEIIEMDRMRKLIAKHMVDSKHTSPHVTSFTEADVTNLVLWRERVKKDFEKRENEKITFTPLFIEAIVRCIKKYPWLNSSIDGDKLVVKKDINMGMATALPSGNLIVPVIKNADQLNLVGLTKQVNNLASAARNNKLRPDDTSGGTFTLTNVGSFGSLMGTPIINQPQVAILAVGAIKKRPVVIETEQGDSIAIRHMMYLSMSYDHRIIDGALGATFLNAVAKELENFDGNREV
ncbi:MAG: 2-oxo acid dehydrogenase subunit E2 [Chitinophagaceae bacterium]|nr:2-oxo acid dehydrogenase subunit E2 [Chitinophagaceae bacterium]